jgi:hypothetical protein
MNIDKLCNDYPELPTILPPVDRIIAIGDLHGDWILTIEILQKLKLIDNDLNWIGDNTVVVQVGDQIDRCRPNGKRCDEPDATYEDEASDLKILEYFNKLHKQALEKKGGVYSLLGNHELMNVQGNTNYVSYESLREAIYEANKCYGLNLSNENVEESGKKAREKLFKPGNYYARLLGCSRLSTLIIGDYLFAHAGVLPKYLKKNNIKSRDDLEDLNHKVSKWLLGCIDEHTIKDIIDSYETSPFWTRILGKLPLGLDINDPKCIEYVKPVLDTFNLKGMVVGHTAQFYQNKKGISSTCNDSVHFIDIGLSKAFDPLDSHKKKTGTIDPNRELQVIEILNNEKINIIDLK